MPDALMFLGEREPKVAKPVSFFLDKGGLDRARIVGVLVRPKGFW